MPRTKGSKNKKTKTVTKVTKCNCPPGFECKPKPKKKTTTAVKTKIAPLKQPINTMDVSRSSSQNLGFHPRGLIDNQPQQPTLIQTIQAPPDPRLDKLDKQLKKIKEYLKDKGNTKENPIHVNSPTFQDAFETPTKQKTYKINI